MALFILIADICSSFRLYAFGGYDKMTTEQPFYIFHWKGMTPITIQIIHMSSVELVDRKELYCET